MPGGNNESAKRKKRGRGGGKEKTLRCKGRDPTSTDLPTVILVEIVRPSFNFNSLPEFTMMELSNLGHDLGLLYTDLMLGLIHMLC